VLEILGYLDEHVQEALRLGSRKVDPRQTGGVSVACVEFYEQSTCNRCIHGFR